MQVRFLFNLNINSSSFTKYSKLFIPKSLSYLYFFITGLVHNLKPTKFGFQLTAEGYSEKMPQLISTIVQAIYKCDFSENQIKTVLEVHRKGLQSCAAEPLKNQSKYLLNAFLSAKIWTREQRLGAMEEISLQEVVTFARSFLDSHSLECLYYGNMTKDEVNYCLIDIRYV